MKRVRLRILGASVTLALLAAATVANSGSVSAQSAVDGTIVINTTTSGRPFGALQYGSNATFFIPPVMLEDPRLIAKTREATSFLRYPGGQSSQLWGWASCELGYQFGSSVPCHPNRNDLVTPSQFARFSLATGTAESVVTVNINATAQENAAFVAFYNGTPGDTRVIGVDQTGTDWRTVGFWAQQRVDKGIVNPLRVKYWEFGNETYGGIVGDNNCLGYGWENTWSCDPVEIIRGTGSGASRKDGYRAQKAAMRAVDSSVQVGVPAVEKKNDQNNWSRRLLAEAGNEIDFLTVHPYFIYVPPANTPAGNAEILSYPQSHFPQVDADFTAIENEIGLNRQVPVLISEYNLTPNAFNDNNRRVEWMLNAMIMGDAVGQMAGRSRFLGVNEHTLFADNFNNTEYGMIKFDNDLSRMATYWALALWKRFGTEFIGVNSSFNAAADLSVYAGRRNGKTVLYVINKAEATKTARITLNGAARITGEYADSVVASSLSDTRPAFNGVSNPNDSLTNAPGQSRSYGGGNSIDRSFPGTSITLLELSTDGTGPSPTTVVPTTLAPPPTTIAPGPTTTRVTPTTVVPTTLAPTPTTTPVPQRCATGGVIVGGENTVQQNTGCVIGDRVWIDANNNGMIDSGESGASGISMMLLDGGSDTGRRVTTDGSGTYSFGGLPAGDGYRVCFGLPSGFAGSNGSGTTARGQLDTTAPDPNNYLDNDDNGKNAGSLQCSGYVIVSDQRPRTVRVDFGIYADGSTPAPTTSSPATSVPPTTTGPATTVVPVTTTPSPTTTTPTLPNRSIGNLVWNDANNNGVVDTNEAGIGNVKVSLSDGSLFLSQTTTTSGGGYSFTGLANSGSYQVCIENPAGFVNSNGSGRVEAGQSDAVGTDPNNYLDNDDNGRTTPVGHCSGFIMNDALLKNPRVDFGLFAPGSLTGGSSGFRIGNLVWNDVNNNGVREAAEPGIPGVTATLFLNQERTTKTSVTNAAGEYSFDGLASSDSYQVCVGVPDGMIGSNGSGSTVRDQRDASANDPNNYLDDDDNGFYTRGLHCSGYIILSDRLPSNQRVDFGFSTPDRAASALRAVGYDPSGTRVLTGPGANFRQVLIQFPADATIAAPTGQLSVRQVSGPAVTVTDPTIANRSPNPNAPNTLAFGVVGTIAAPDTSVIEVTYAGDATWAPVTLRLTITTVA